jgi:hypothetical protein
MTTDDAIQHAAQYLPVGWELIIAVEAGCADAELFDDQGESRITLYVLEPELICGLVDSARSMAGALSVPRPE